MCHHRGYTPEWRSERPETATDETEDETATDELPSFLNDEAAEDVEVLTDGGDGDNGDNGDDSA
ncbi:hypothetical protein [Haloarcula amylovorans]|uniref:hypothetical protein n=1 Tax=Haloarcula amylovorans TaxID=2562280 RepID=UPI0010761C3E|nr:hypothetical protein [Halomicroarcula amylolytica]